MNRQNVFSLILLLPFSSSLLLHADPVDHLKNAMHAAGKGISEGAEAVAHKASEVFGGLSKSSLREKLQAAGAALAHLEEHHDHDGRLLKEARGQIAAVSAEVSQIGAIVGTSPVEGVGATLQEGFDKVKNIVPAITPSRWQLLKNWVAENPGTTFLISAGTAVAIYLIYQAYYAEEARETRDVTSTPGATVVETL